MPLTLDDIARLSGVSRATVSRVINADVNVKDSTRLKVQEIINSYNFQPNLAARGLATGRTNVLGVVVPAGVVAIFTDPYFPKLLQGVSAVCNNREYSVMLWLAEPEYERRMISRILHNGLVDGVIVASISMDDSIIQSLIDSKMPFVLIGRHPTENVNYLDVDNLQASRMATMHLVRLGYKRIATITGVQYQVAGYDRYQGYLKALKDSGQPIRQELVVEGAFTEESGYSGMQHLLKYKPDAVFAASDMMAYGAMRALREANLRIPEDVAVVGFDDIPNSAKTIPTLTTVRQPVSGLGSKAADMLINIIETRPTSIQKIILDTELVVRESCGASMMK
ncbi:MAG: LacI family DNA-binding transcriptional regulator [Anaerolineaceae bacterium]|nr:LacI family DNA-binding transcriptional regulator [Anaerolineaceae bacterium]